MSTPVRVFVVGSKGRMGEAVVAAASSDAAICIVGEQDRPGAELALGTSDVVIDFSHSDVAADLCSAAVAQRKPLVIGTTGHSSSQAECIQAASNHVAIVFAPNFSVGMNALFWIARKTSELLGADFDAEVVEMHHRLKKDAPSGSALRLVDLLLAARNLTASDVKTGRAGMVGERPRSEVGVHAVRGGDVVGEHTVIFAGAGERLELSHKASNRSTFAVGALRAAKWIVDRPPGLYSMEDVLGLRE